MNGRVKLALAGFGILACLGGAAFALAQSGLSTSSVAMDHGPAANKSTRSLNIRVNPSTRSIEPGETAEYRIRIRHRGNGKGLRARRNVDLRLLGNLPHGTTASFNQSSIRTKRAKLTILAGDGDGSGHRLRVVANSGKRQAMAGINLVIGTPESVDFTIGGDLTTMLEPGLSIPLDLSLTNPGSTDINVTDLVVGIDTVNAPQADATHPCTAEDFAIAQYSGAYGLTLTPMSTTALTDLAVPTDQLPRVMMLNRPVNQDGCKGATLAFRFTGIAGTE